MVVVACGVWRLLIQNVYPSITGDDPKRGWTFDFNYDSKRENDVMTLVHGCVEGTLFVVAYNE